MAKSFKFKNDMYLDLSGIYCKKENVNLSDMIRVSVFSIIQGKRYNADKKVTYTSKVGSGQRTFDGEIHSSTALELTSEDDSTVVGRIDVLDNGRILNSITKSFLMEESKQTISASNFFTSTTYPVEEGYIYKVGNLINIQRLVFFNIPRKSSEMTIGFIKSEYAPATKRAVRFAFSSGGALMDGIGYIGQSGDIVIMNEKNDNSLGNFYMYNMTYVI